MSTPQAQSDLEVYHVVFEQHFYLRWVLFRFMWCRSPCALCLAPCALPKGTAPSSSSISCSTKLQQPISALCFEKPSAFRLKAAHEDSKSPSPILHLKCSISGKTGLSDSRSDEEVRSGKFELLDRPSSVSDLIENILFKDFNLLILFKIKFLSARKVRYFSWNFFKFGVSS